MSFSYEKMSTKTRFEEEAKGNSEMAYYNKNVGKQSQKYSWKENVDKQSQNTLV